jgi:hypothetical protein
MGRGDCGDVDPTHLGYECFTNGKVYNNSDLSTATALTSSVPAQIGTDLPAANFRIWWDGDLLSEQLDGGTISKWAYPGAPSGGFTGATLAFSNMPGGNRPPLYGDMFGDWREEVMLENSGSIRIYTTAIPTEKRLYTLMHNPEYRNAMVEKGYTQSRFVDYYLGEGMTDPPRPNITYPDGCAGCAGAGGGGTTGAAGAGGGGITGASGGSIVSGGTPATGGAGAPGGRGGRGGSVAASGGSPRTGGTSAPVGTGGAAVAGTGGTAPGTGGNPLATGGSTLGASGGAAMAGAGGTSAAEPGTGGSTNGGEGGAVGGQSDTIAAQAAAGSGCSCAIGATSGRTSAGYFVITLGALGLALNRRRQRGKFSPRK